MRKGISEKGAFNRALSVAKKNAVFFAPLPFIEYLCTISLKSSVHYVNLGRKPG